MARVNHRGSRHVRAGLAVAVALLAIAASACSASSPSAGVSVQTGAIATPVPQFGGATQTNDGGQVMVAVTRDVHQATPVFNVALVTPNSPDPVTLL
jgi:hypothetical protein